MDNIKSFLESSTIHGLGYISTTRRCTRVFWILVIISGFSGAGFLIYQSFNGWAEAPVTTTIETQPIKDLTFPKVTVCPPKDTFTDLNYDLIMTENMTLGNDTRNELSSYVIELLNENLYDSMITNITNLQDDQKYFNWYHGYTLFRLPNAGPTIPCCGYDVFYPVNTVATSGSMSSLHFGDMFDADKVERDVWYSLYVDPPENYYSRNLANNTNVTLHVEIQKKSMASGEDTLHFRGEIREKDHFVVNMNPPESFTAYFRRKVTQKDVKEAKLNTMPGFKMSWYYTGNDEKADARYYTDPNYNVINKIFIRNFFYIIDTILFLYIGLRYLYVLFTLLKRHSMQQ